MLPSRREYDAVVVGAGPNGLAAAITVARSGKSILLLEGCPTVGGGARSGALTLPGFNHDICSAVHPMGVWSPFFRQLPLAQHGLEWIHPVAPLAHPLDDGTAVVLHRSVDATAEGLGEDRNRYLDVIGSFVSSWSKLEPLIENALQIPAHPFAAAKFGLNSIRSARSFATGAFKNERTRALIAGIAAHSILPLERAFSAGFAIVLTMIAHKFGWPFAEGGSQKIPDALAVHLASLGGEIVTSRSVESLAQIPSSKAVLFDVTPRQLLRMAGSHFPEAFRKKLAFYRYGPGVCKLDWALDGPIPWTAKECSDAGTVHVGGTLDEIAAAERDAWQGKHSLYPFVILAQPTLFDRSRAPQGKHIAWAYCHVPNGSTIDMSDRIEAQIERFAPGFRKSILERSVKLAANMESYNPNLIGGDITGGTAELGQFFFRPTRKIYRTPAKHIYLCSSSTPPGPGVHGMCGYLAAKTALRDRF